MSNTDAVLESLDVGPQPCCDDCLSRDAHVAPRQQVYAICRRLADKATIARGDGSCARCGSEKIVNSIPPQQGRSTASLAAESRPPASATRQQVRPLSIEALRNHLDRFCRDLHGNPETSPRTGLAALISELRDRGIVPGHQANMMQTICGLRNAYVHDHIELGEGEVAVANGAWKIISEWAERHEPDKWRLTRRDG